MNIIVFLGVMLLQQSNQLEDWARFTNLIERAVPQHGRVQLLYEVVDPPGVFSKELIGQDFERGGVFRVHDGDILGISPAGRQFGGSLSMGCVWIDPPEAYPPEMLHPSALITAPYEILRLILQRPELVLDLRPNEVGGFHFDIEVLGGMPILTPADFPDGHSVPSERWSIEIGSSGHLNMRVSSTTVEYEYGESLWPIAFKTTKATIGTRQWRLVQVGELASNAFSPAGALQVLSAFETRHIPGPTDESQAAQGIGPVPGGYERDPARRWSFALVVGGILILVLGGGVIVRRRYAGS